jgi:hypothetical protein
MDPIPFVSNKEKQCKHLINNTVLEHLDRERIAIGLERNLIF